MTSPDLSELARYWNCHLTTIGRRSKEPRRVTIWFVPGEGSIFLTGSRSVPQWCRNLRADPAVGLEIGPRRFSGRAKLIDDESEAAAIRQRFVERYLLARLSRPFGGYTDSVPVEVVLDT